MSPAVLCYGDSNTWGYAASTQARLTRWERWPGVLQQALGDEVHVVEEGLNGRTTVFEVPYEPGRNGLTHLPVSLQTHAPLDLVVISLGTNDLFVSGVNAFHAAHGAMKLAEIALGSKCGPNDATPQVLVLVPPPFLPLGIWEPDAPQGLVESQRFAEHFATMAVEYGGVSLLQLGAHIASSPIDGIHFERADHRVIGEVVAACVRPMLGLA
ncbi:MAG: GDSL-type esterase/lipase family protein [Actinomycetota bacterium]